MLYIVLYLLLALILIVWILYFLVIAKVYNQIPNLSKRATEKSSRPLPLISVIIPARNEAHRIKKFIELLKLQTYPKLEIIIVDDYSTDDTIKISNKTIGGDKRFRVLNLRSIQKEKPKDWMGKSYAVQQGSIQAKGKWLVFIDADIEISPEMIKRSVIFAAKNNLDFLSVLPHHICETFWEKAIQPIPLELLLLNLYNVNKPTSKVAVAFGCYIFIKKSVFQELGGYEKIKYKIVDDAELAKLVKRSGYKICIAKGHDLIKVRMYEQLNEIFEGWRKNILLGAVQNTRISSKVLKAILVLIGLACVFDVFILPFLLIIPSLILGLYYSSIEWEFLFILSSLIWLYGVIIQYEIQKRFFIGDPKYAFLSVLGCIMSLAIMLSAITRILTGKGIVWKGRTYFKSD